MSQSIRFSSGFGPTLQHIPNSKCIFPTKHTCIFPSKHTCMDVSYPILSVEVCRKRAWILVSNRNPRAPFLFSATFNDVGTSKGMDDKAENLPAGVLTIRILRLLLDYDDPKDGLGIGNATLIGALQVWRQRNFALNLKFCYVDPFRHFFPTELSKDEVKYISPKLTKRVLTIVMLMVDLNDPNDGFKALIHAFKWWKIILLGVGFDFNEEVVKPDHPWWPVLKLFKLMVDNLNTPSEFTEVLSGINLRDSEMLRLVEERVKERMKRQKK